MSTETIIALVAIGLTVLGGFGTMISGLIWLIWNASALNSKLAATDTKVDETRLEIKQHRVDFREHIDCDNKNHEATLALMAVSDKRLALLEAPKKR